MFIYSLAKLVDCHIHLICLKQLLRNKLVSTARKSMRRNVNLSQLYQNMKEAYDEMQTPLVPQMPPTLVNVLHDFQLIWNLWSSLSLSLVYSSSRGWKNWRSLLLNWLQVMDILMPLLMRLSLMWIRMLMTFCQLKLKSNV